MRSVVRALLPVAVLLLGLQLAAAGRTLQQTPKSVPVALTRQQFVQATFGLKGVTCDQVSAILNDPFVNNTFSRAVIADFQTQLIKDGWPAAAAVVVAVRQPCLTSNIDGENYASYRTMIRFNSTNSTSTRDTMFAGLSTAVARPCTGGYNRGLYRAVTALFAQLPFNVSQNNGNRQNVFFPNGPGPTGFGDNWIDYASPAMSYCDYLRSPSPSPSPSPEAPSPSPEAPSPSPETPSPSPELCPANATRNESGACVCDAGFTSALNGTTVIACLNSTGLTSCPASAPVAVKPVDDPAPMIMSCITQDTPCPAGFTLALYSGNPSVRQECRPNNGGCNYAGFGIQVTTADNTLIGCANSTSNACPFVAYRSAPTFAVDKCVQVTSCPAYSVPSSVLHTVPALEVGSSVPVACLTLDTTTNTCPDLPALRYPLEVVFASGSVNPCGSTAQPCIAAATRTIECRTANATCPAAQSLRLYGGSGATPVVVECRQTRSSCDLTAVGMTDKTPNAGSYNIAVRTGDALDGCIIAGATTCPAGYPYPTRDNNALVSCTPTVPAVQCTGTQVPLLNANGTTAACQSNNLACPTTFPITLRTESSGNVAGCSALTSTCPTAYPFPLYSKFTSVPGVDASATVLTNCWQAGFISTCSTVFFADDSQPAGIGGRYNVPIVTNTTGTEQLLGCVLQGSATCPSLPTQSSPSTALSQRLPPPPPTSLLAAAPKAPLAARTARSPSPWWRKPLPTQWSVCHRSMASPPALTILTPNIMVCQSSVPMALP
ncbi:hypothetical protein COO60DRAFT_496788 [Scenedesmus sp. NREL 46B-D3]|nr:hypothetical protein COO60DRAFT_496788 [Scenedesmus sp. NREL 46B-D3]